MAIRRERITKVKQSPNPKTAKKPAGIDTSIWKVNKKYAREEIVSAQKWFKDRIKELSTDTKKYKMSDLRLRTSLPDTLLGSMLFYKYDPKYKETLPYYDIFPVIIMIGEYDNGWLGLNLHYLPPKLRILFLGKLINTVTNVKFDKTTKLKATYQLLKSSVKYKYFRPCLKRYLSSHVVSKMQIIRPEQWHRAILLPVARFQKASEQTVWTESRRIINQ